MAVFDIERHATCTAITQTGTDAQSERQITKAGKIRDPEIRNPDSTGPRSQSAASQTSSSQVSRTKETAHEGPELPRKRDGCGVARHVKHRLLSYYRRTFSIIFAANLVALIVMISVHHSSIELAVDTQLAVSINITVAFLFRQEYFVNLTYKIMTCVPHWYPIWIRRRCAKVFHYGGAHSGCAVAAVTWHILYTALTTRIFVGRSRANAKSAVDRSTRDAMSSLITSWILIVMFLAIIAAAHPRFRARYHNQFEYTHRFAGWSALAVFWTHLILVAEEVRKTKGVSLAFYLAKSANFWLLVISTSCIISSWSRLRSRRVTSEKVSDHAIRLYFDGRGHKPFYGLKFSDNPLIEWHAFATIPDTDESGRVTGFSVLVSNAGDWTNKIIMNPPEKLWIRGSPLYGLLYGSRVFKRIVIVATGSGIGPMLSLMFAKITPLRVLWATPNPELTFGSKVVNTVLEADPKAVIWNTRKQGRPDMVRLAYLLYRKFDAEAVFIISNPGLTRKVVYGMESRGIPAYGAIFDS